MRVCVACLFYSVFFFGVQVMATTDFSVVEFSDHSVSVVPTSWIFRDDNSSLRCHWNSSMEKAKKAVRPHPKWSTCKIRKIVAHKGQHSAMPLICHMLQWIPVNKLCVDCGHVIILICEFGNTARQNNE